MKISKITLAISSIIFIVFIVIVGRFAYSIGQHNASLTVKEATPMQLAEAMQGDDIYSKYAEAMLLVDGTVQSVNKKENDTLVQFEVSKSPTALGKVTCDVQNSKSVIKVGDTIRVLAVAHDAERQHTTDVFIPNCYLLKR